MTQCQRCGTAVADDSRFCPSCGKALGLGTAFPSSFGPDSPAPRPPKNSAQSCLTYLGWAVLIVIALVIVTKAISPVSSNLSSDIDPATPAETPSPTPTASSSPPIAISAADLWRAYDANEARAQATYGPGPLLVTGTVDSVGINFDKSPSVSLVTPNTFMSAHVELVPADHPRALQLNKGDQITVRCATASITLGSPFLHDCTFLPAPKSQK